MGGFGSGGCRSFNSVDTMPADDGPAQPDGLAADVAEKWQILASQIPAGTMRSVDAHLLRMLAELLAHSDRLTGRLEADPDDDKVARLLLNCCDRIARLSGLFGLSPADRRRGNFEPAPQNAETDPVLYMLARMQKARETA